MIEKKIEFKEQDRFYKKLSDIIKSDEQAIYVIGLLNSEIDSEQINRFFTYELFVKKIAKKNYNNKNESLFLDFLVNTKYQSLSYNTQKEVLNALAFKQWLNNNFKLAFDTIKRFKIEFKERDDKAYAICLNIFGMVNLKLDKPKEALETFYDALAVLERNDRQDCRKWICNINNNIALTYKSQKELGNALKIYYKNITIQEKMKDVLGLSMSYMNIGNTYFYKKEYEKAIEYSLKAQKLKFEIGDITHAESINLNLAIFNFELGEFKKVKQYADKCLKSNIAEDEKVITGIILKMELLAFEKSDKTALNQQKLLATANECLKNIDQLSGTAYKLDYYPFIAKAFELSGNTDKAISLVNKKFELYKEQNDLERLRAYQQLREIHEIQLQQKEVDKKELELEQKEKTNIKLQEINNELEQFTYMASHDLKSPLRNIIAFSSLIKEEDVSKADINDYADLIKNDAKKMSKLITSLLKHSKIENTQIEMESVPLGELVKMVVRNLNQDILFRNALVEVGELPTINGNKILLEQLFINLIENALKYNESNKPIIKIYSEQQKDKALINISDNGIGLPEAMKQEVFEAFTRAHSETKYEGSGVGLATCKKIMNIHSGTISVSSEVSKGSCFTLSFKC